MDYAKKSTYLFAIDALRVLAIIAVILIHTSTVTLQSLQHNTDSGAISLFLNQSARFAVPLFFLISGFVLELNNKKTLSYILYFKKRASRVILPFIFWSIFYTLLGNGFSFTRVLRLEFFNTLFNGTASYHLYFIPTLIVFYLAFPILHTMLSVFKKLYVILPLAVMQIYLLFQDYYVQKLPIDDTLRIVVLSFLMFVLGMIASHYKDTIFTFAQKYIAILTLSLVFLVAIVFIHVSYLTKNNHTTSYIYNQFSPLNLIYSLVFTLVMYFFMSKLPKIVQNSIKTMSKLSFFVFFIHVFVITFVWENAISNYLQTHGKNILSQFWFDPLMLIIITTTSFLIAYLVHKISWAHKITG